jgi:hypothetical protein
MDPLLLHIFDKSACLNCRQMISYINGTMTAEECHAAEHHLNSCSLCSEATEGIQAFHKDATQVMTELSPGFLRSYFEAQAQPTEINNTKNAVPVSNRSRNTAFVIAGCLGIIIFIFFYFGKSKHPHTQNNETIVTPKEIQHNVLNPTPTPRDTTTHPANMPEKISPHNKIRVVTTTIRTPAVTKKKIVLKYDADMATDTAYTNTIVEEDKNTPQTNR